MNRDSGRPPLVAHLIYRFALGGMEHMLATLINRMPPERYRHVIITLTEADGYQDRITAPDVEFVELRKRPGQDPAHYARLWRELRRLRPQILHTRNLAAMEAQWLAAAAGVPGRVHGEHGRDTYDLDGASIRYNLLRKTVRPFIHSYIAVSRDLQSWLIKTVGVAPGRVRQIYNGVDTELYRPRGGAKPGVGPVGFARDGTLLLGAVGRLAEVKDHASLIRAFALLRESNAEWRSRLRLVIVGDGPMAAGTRRLIEQTGSADAAWLAGERRDVASILQALDLFVLPSLGEGISNTLLEAMACGLPVVATAVGGNLELVDDGVTGRLTPVQDPQALANAIDAALRNPRELALQGARARERAVCRFSLDAMMNGYLGVYDALLAQR
ncbi:MAG: TIGR03088 family PEP-CTERM/XrtA system glycosyltransferase [Acidobacteria bacterium]|nr:TIGR03088 family PEP-CTERM/XrtA system glycosyltransferase [Acidobacteriota bacterium]